MMISLSRRMVIRGAMAVPIAWCLRALPAEALAPDPGRDSDHPYLPNATFGYAAWTSNIGADSMFSEPIDMFLNVYGFGSETDAHEAFPEVVAYLEDRRDELAVEFSEDGDADDADYEHRHISVGLLGDERSAYYAAPSDGLHMLLVVVRVGPNILNLLGLAFGGSTDEYVASFLEEFLSGATDDPMSLVPDISDLPVGWEMKDPVWAGDILDIITTPAIRATPTT